MNKMRVFLSITLGAILAVQLALVGYLGAYLLDQPPEIAHLSANPSVIKVGDESIMIVKAYDPDSAPEDIRITWSVTEGGQLSAGKYSFTAVFKANNPGSYKVTVTATDEFGLSTSTSYTVLVTRE